MWGGGGPWLGGIGELSVVGWVDVTFYVAVFRVQGALQFLDVVFSTFWFWLCWPFVSIISNKNKNKISKLLGVNFFTK
jgi:hypothetical protein